MIPKIIHYCWFGGSPLPPLARMCINSWKKYCPDYEIKEWNEHNFDVNITPYTREAYARKKYAFVSDYARFHILSQYGGIYFDTDVELIRPISHIVKKGAFMAYEQAGVDGKQSYLIAPGLAIGFEAGAPILQSLLTHYNNLPGYNYESQGTVCDIVSNYLISRGVCMNGKLCTFDNITLYPADYFSPKNVHTQIISITDNTVSIHHYGMSWVDKYIRRRKAIKCFFVRFLPERAAEFLGWSINATLKRLEQIFCPSKRGDK